MDIVPQLNNPAGRLLRILRQGRQIETVASPLHGWAMVFRDNLDDHPWRVLPHIGLLLALPSEIVLAFEKVQALRPEPFLWWCRPFMLAFRSDGLNNWGNFWKKIGNENILSGIEACSNTLSHLRPEKALVESTLATILVDARALVDEVVDSDIDSSLKDFLLKHLDLVERALADYEFQGARPLEVAVDALVGTVTIHADIYDKTAETEVGKRFWKLMGRVAIVVGLATGVPQLPETIQKFLPSGKDAHNVSEQNEDSGTLGVVDRAHASQNDPTQVESEH